MHPSKKSPSFRPLDEAESRALLSRNHMGRLAFTFNDRLDIEPISYVYAGDWLYARTSPGSKLTKLQHHPWVAFEVDEAAGPFDWESVVVHGTAYFITADGPSPQEWRDAVAALRSIDPRALTHEDFAPGRTVVFRIHVDTLTGRSASTNPSPRRTP